MRLAFVPLLLTLCTASFGQGTQADYERADGLAARLQNKVLRATVRPHWIEGGKRMWYVIDVAADKRETYLVDARSGTRELAFDAPRLAKALSDKVGTSLTADTMSVSILGIEGSSLVIASQGKRWLLDRKSYALTERKGDAGAGDIGTLTAFMPPRPSGNNGEETTLTLENRSQIPVDVYWMNPGGGRTKYQTLKPGESRQQHTFAGHVWVFTNAEGRALAAYEATEGACAAIFDGTSPSQAPAPRSPELSPNGKWRAIIRNQNVWLRPTAGGDEVQVSTDGKEGDGYNRPLMWSPDGKFLSAERIEDGQVHKVNIVQSSPADQLQPKMITLDYLKPGDKIPHPRVMIFEVASRKAIPVDTELTPNPWDFTSYRWSEDSRELYFVYNQRGHQVLRLLAANAETGKVRTVVEETSPTFIDYAGKLWSRYLDKTGEVLWASERSGYNHIYLVNLKSGQMKPITQGPWMVRSVERVDPERRQLLLRIMGRDPKQDPYHMHYARVNFDGSGLTMLTEGDGTHAITWSPDGETYIDRYSRVDLPPVTELRRTRDGKKLALLESADDAPLKATGWSAPERFVAKARDGKTDIYGIIIKPTNFDPAKKYPVIESVYAGPQDFFVPKPFSAFRGSARLAELGFIVVHIDGMGTNWRGKAFHDVCYQNLADSGFPDRILWMKAAASSRPWMDLTRVGVYGTSAGGQSAASAVMRFGDFYKAAVADCGCHDNRMDKIWWNELWMGWPMNPSYEANSNVTAAKNLQGKLYLMVGEIDSNVDPTSTMQVVNALIKAGKDFDLLVVPNANHGVLGQPYAFRRMEDFFVRALYGLEPRR